MRVAILHYTIEFVIKFPTILLLTKILNILKFKVGVHFEKNFSFEKIKYTDFKYIKNRVTFIWKIFYYLFLFS